MCRLNKAFYGLKQAPRAWYEKLKTTLLTCGFINAISDTSLFHLKDGDKVVYILVYVNSILITGIQPEMIDDLILKLNKNFSLKMLGCLSYFLRIKVKKDCGGMHLS